MNEIVTIDQDIEIITDNEVSVVIADHPILPIIKHKSSMVGLTVEEILNDHWTGRPCVVRADGYDVPVGMRSKIVPRERIEITGIPGDEISNVVRTIAAVVVTAVALIVAPYIAPAIVAVTGLALQTATVLVGAALTLAGNLAINALFPAAKPQLSGLTSSAATDSDVDQSPTYSIGGGRNEILHYSPLAVILGRHRYSPPYAALPFTEGNGDDQFLRSLFCWGLGNISVTDLRIGETPIGNFQGFQEVRHQNFLTENAANENVGLYPGQVFQQDLNIEIVGGLAQVRTTVDDVDSAIIDITFPNGLVRYVKEDGSRQPYSVPYTIAIQPADGSGGYFEFFRTTATGSSTRTLRRSILVNFPRGKYNIRVLKIQADYTGEDTVVENMVWSALRSNRQEVPVNTDTPMTLSSVRIKASNQLSGVIETLNGTAYSFIQSWNRNTQQWDANTLSNNPADLFRYVLQGPGNKRPVTDDQIDFDSLQSWHEYCEDEGWKFNQVRDFDSSVANVIDDICSAGRAVRVFRNNKWSVVWDDPAAPIVQHFTPLNSQNFNAVRNYVQEIHGFRVTFINEDKNYFQDTRIVYADGYDEFTAAKFETIEFPGVTDPDLIWRHARYHIAQLLLRRETYELTVDFENLICNRGDRVKVTHDVTQWGLEYGRIRSVDNGRVNLVGQVSMLGETNYSILFRHNDGTTTTREVENNPGTHDYVDLVPDAAATIPQEGELWQFGITGQESTILRVREIRPLANLSATIVFVDDAPEIYDADQGTIPPFNSNITDPIDYFDLPPSNLMVTEVLDIVEETLRSNARVSWKAPDGPVQSYTIEYKINDPLIDWNAPITVPAPANSYDVLDLAPGDYVFRMKANFGSIFSGYTNEYQINLLSAFSTPINVENFIVNSSAGAGTVTLNWNLINNVIIRGYEIRYSPLTVGASWANAVVLATDVTNDFYITEHLRGTYFIKAVSFNNVYSKDATLIVLNSQPLSNINIVESIVEDPSWSGVFDNTEYDALLGGVILKSTARFFDEPLFFHGGTFFKTEAGRQTEGKYYFANSIDLGQISTFTLSFDVSVGGHNFESLFFSPALFFTEPLFFPQDPDNWSFSIDVRTTDDDPAGSPTWSDWFPANGASIQARAIEGRMNLMSFSSQSTPLVVALTMTADMPDRIEAQEDVQSTTLGYTVNLTPPFNRIKARIVNGQNMAQGDYFTITEKISGESFKVTFFDSANNPKDVLFDYQVVGYGEII